MLATVRSGAVIGLDATPIAVEVDYNPRGMTGFTIPGALTRRSLNIDDFAVFDDEPMAA
jgi:hypothetical protein